MESQGAPRKASCYSLSTFVAVKLPWICQQQGALRDMDNSGVKRNFKSSFLDPYTQ